MQTRMTPTKRIHDDRRTGITNVLVVTEGMPQGGVVSTAQYCVSKSVRILNKLRGELIEAISAISDNITIIATTEDLEKEVKEWS